MNLLLLDEIADSCEIARIHPRYESLSRLSGPEICVGVPHGPRGIGRWERCGGDAYRVFAIRWEKEIPPEPPPIDVGIGLPRPGEVRRILFLAGLWGVSRIRFIELERTPPGYATSRVLETEAVAEVLREGVEQGFHTRVPEYGGLIRLDELLAAGESRTLVLDPYLGESLLDGYADASAFPMTLILGGERGFSGEEQGRIRDSDSRVGHLGPVILRSEAALATALPLIFRESGFLDSSASACIQGT